MQRKESLIRGRSGHCQGLVTVSAVEASGQYQQKALVQQAPAERLLALTNISAKDDVWDVGCGPGRITHRIKIMTQGWAVGADVSSGVVVESGHIWFLTLVCDKHNLKGSASA